MMRKNGFSQLRKLLPVVAVCALALTVGCSDDDDTTKPPSEFAPPSNLTFSNNARVGRVDLSWTASPDQSAGDFAGYNVYQSPTSLAGMTGAELSHEETKDMAPIGGARLAAILRHAIGEGLLDG